MCKYLKYIRMLYFSVSLVTFTAYTELGLGVHTPIEDQMFNTKIMG